MSDTATPSDAAPIAITDPVTELGSLRFDNRSTAELPADSQVGSGPRQVLGAAYSRVQPAVTADPRVIAWSKSVSDQLGLDDEVWADREAALVFTGNGLLAHGDPHAANYGGHQFGNWAGQLGDGRAIALGEVIDVHGQHQMLQLKGAGPTPYSRGADGLAVLRSSVREYLCSEAMHHLGVPTTRALSLALTGDQVVRDMFYDGNPRPEPGAVVSRVAPSFLRFGSYQLFAARGELDELRTLVDFTLRHHFAHLLPGDGQPTHATYAAWFADVCASSCDLVIEWMRVGFVHGVMNTDNMSILGLTIDYGPYGWLDDFDRDWTPNTTDAGGRRYRFGYQPQIVQWNLLQLANAIFALLEDPEPLEAALNQFAERYRSGYRSMMLAKLGLTASAQEAADDSLIADLPDLLEAAETDMTIFFRRLADSPLPAELLEGGGSADLDALGLGDAYYELAAVGPDVRARLGEWLDRYRLRTLGEERSHSERAVVMNAVNPKYVLRNYLAQLAIDAAEGGDYSLIAELAQVLAKPYDSQPEFEAHAGLRPDWARSRPGCSMLSCSS